VVYTFDDLEDVAGGPANRNPKPFWAINAEKQTNKKDVLEWLRGEIQFLRGEQRDRVRQNEKNLQLYRGIQYETQELRTAVRDRSDDRSRVVQRIVVNHLYDLTESWVSRAMKHKPAIGVNPVNDEFRDRISAKMTKNLLDHIWYQKRFRGNMLPNIVRSSKIMGENYVEITWDPSLGEEHPAYKKAVEKGVELKLKDEAGNDVLDPQGNKVLIKERVMQGDVKYEIVMSNDVYTQQVNFYEKSDHAFRREVMDAEKVRKDYPKQAADLEAEHNTQVFDYERMELRKMNNEIVVWHYWHRKTQEMPDGWYAKFTDGALLENKKHPYKHKEFPWERLTDIDIPGKRHGESFFYMIKGMTSVYNNLTNMIIRNQKLCSHPKWMMPAGAAKLESLGNDITVVQYKGPVAPQLIQMNPTSPEVFEFRQMLKDEFSQISGIHGISRGEPPKGISAGIALQFLDEQEHERSSSFNVKFSQFLRDVAEKTISVAAQFYKEDDERMIMVQGKNNAWMQEYFDPTHLEAGFDIRVENLNALPESRSGKKQMIIDLMEMKPELFSDEQILDMLDMSNVEGFYDAATVAVRSAQVENEMITEGKKIEDPEEHEDHIGHWRVHYRQIQDYGFKSLPEKVKEGLKTHIRATEMMMFEKAKINPTFKMKLLELKDFPLLYAPSAEDKQALSIMQEMAGGGQPQAKPKAPEAGSAIANQAPMGDVQPEPMP